MPENALQAIKLENPQSLSRPRFSGVLPPFKPCVFFLKAAGKSPCKQAYSLPSRRKQGIRLQKFLPISKKETLFIII